jgi:hypothetical protein
MSYREEVSKLLVTAIQKTGERAFQYSQTNCPIITGKLKSTGKTILQGDGIILKYEAEYASFVERGIKAGIVRVPAYIKRNRVKVRAYSYYQNGQRAQKYIEKGMEEAFKDFGDYFERELKSKFANRSIKILRKKI